MVTGYIPTGIIYPEGGGGGVYSATLSSVILAIETLLRGAVRLVVALYHPLIRCHTSYTRVGSDVRRDSTVFPASAAHHCQSLCRKTQIRRPNIMILV